MGDVVSMEEVVATSELVEHVKAVVEEVRGAHGRLMGSVSRLEGHELDDSAHGIKNPESPFRKSMLDAAAQALFEIDGASDEFVKKVRTYIGNYLPGELEKELNEPSSPANARVKAFIDAAVN